MPSYLIHGFRWNRLNIRLHIIRNDVEDAASEWIINPPTANALIESFYEKFYFLPPIPPPPPSSQTSLSRRPKDAPKKLSNLMRQQSRENFRRFVKSSLRKNQNDQEKLLDDTNETLDTGQVVKFNDWSPVKLLEQFDADERYTCSQPFAFVADHLVEIRLSVDIEREKHRYKEICTTQYWNNDMIYDSGSHSESQKGKTSATPREEGSEVVLNPDNNGKIGWFERLRDELEPDEHVRWYVVHCGDLERHVPEWAQEIESLGNPNESPPSTSWSAGLKGFFKG